MRIAAACSTIALFLLFFCGVLHARSVQFSPAKRHGTSKRIENLALGDFNGDGFLDVAATSDQSILYIFLGAGDGTLQLAQQYSTRNGLLDGLVTGDFNGDGKPDLALAAIVGSTGLDVVTIYLGQGDGSFVDDGDTPTDAEHGPGQIAVADFNEDGKLDLAVTNFASTLLTRLLGNGDGIFTSAGDLTTQATPFPVVAADFNHDGHIDLAVGNYGSNNVSIYLGNGNGAFVASGLYSTDAEPRGLIVLDLNGDHNLDLATVNMGSDTVSVLLGNGNGTFGSPSNYPVGSYPACLAAGDFNEDGVADAIIANEISGTVSLLLGTGDGGFAPQSTFIGGKSVPIAAGDLNSDGAVDVVTGDFYNKVGVVVLLNGNGIRMEMKSSIDPSKVGESVTFTAIVKASFRNRGVPSGSITFKDGETFLATVPLTGSSATYATSSLTEGNHSIIGIYSGDDNFNPNRAKVLQKVTQ